MTFKTIILLLSTFCFSNFTFVNCQTTPQQYLEKGLKFRESGNHDSSFYYFQQGIIRSQELKSTIVITDLTIELANAHKFKMNYLEAFNIYSSLEKKLKKGQEYENLGKVYIAFIEFYRKRGKFDKAKKYMALMDDLISKENISQKSRGRFYSRCAAVVIESGGDIEKSMFYSFKTLEMAKNMGDLNLEATALNEIGFAYENLKPAKASYYYSKALNIWSSIESKPGTVSALTNLGRISSKLGHVEKAKSYYLQGIAIASKHNILSVEKEMLLNLYLIYRKNKEYEKAIDALTGFYNAERTETSLEANKSLLTVERKYDLEKEINKRKSATDRAKLAEAETRSKTLQIYIWGIISLCSFLLLFIISRLLYKLRKSNKLVLSSNLELANTIEQKEFIFRELHHRVKNNLSILNSLLFLQAKESKHIETQTILAECQARIHSMAVVHENLLEVNDNSKVELKPFVIKLINDLKKSFLSQESTIDLTIEGDNIFLDMSISVFIGFTLNELVTNSMKYAKPESHSLGLGIEFFRQENLLTINYWDNGIGLSDGKMIVDQGGFGFKLIRIMMDQLDSEMNYSNSDGKSCFSFSFNLNKAA